jgi:hypothetical protein
MPAERRLECTRARHCRRGRPFASPHRRPRERRNAPRHSTGSVEPSNGPSYPPSQSCKTMRSTRMPWRPEKLGDGLQRSTGRKFVIGKPSFAPYAVATHRNAPLRVRTRSCNWQQSFRGLPVATAMNNSIRLPRSTARRRSGTLSNGSRRDEHRCPSYFRVFTSSSRARRYRSKARSRLGLAPENSSTP